MIEQNKRFLHIFVLICAGAVVGLVNGFFGGGGGMVCVPLLLLMGLNNKKAQATAILIMVPISIASGVVYYSHGFLSLNQLFFVGIGSIVGGILGALILKKLSNNALQYIFAVVVLLAGLKMII